MRSNKLLQASTISCESLMPRQVQFESIVEVAPLTVKMTKLCFCSYFFSKRLKTSKTFFFSAHKRLMSNFEHKFVTLAS